MALSPAPLRLLDACPACARQYDVTHLAPGQAVRCACERVFEAQHRRPHAPRALRCSACGANLREEARACDHCQAEITLEERLLGSVCPGCYARARVDARFCMECGQRIAPQALAALPAGGACPRCEGELRSRALDGGGVIECAACGGMWLEPDALDGLARRAARELAVPLPGQARPQRAVRDEARYLPCPQCGDRMVRRNYPARSGIVLDLCRAHGVWLDHGEIERVVDFARTAGEVAPLLSDPVLAARRDPDRPPPVIPVRPPRGRLRRAFDFVVDVLATVCTR